MCGVFLFSWVSTTVFIGAIYVITPHGYLGHTILTLSFNFARFEIVLV